MEDLVARAELRRRVRFRGVLVGDAKWAEYARADIFCFPSFFEAESFGLAVLEAMSFSLPVVATRWRGLPDIVEDGASGYLVPIRDPVALADRLARLLDAPTLRAQFGQAGRNRFLRNFTLSQHLSAVDQLFEQLARGDEPP
jgi:glycosyltransferase involved in cell wall biosynthesis